METVAARRPNAVSAEISSVISQKHMVNDTVCQKGLGYAELALKVNIVDDVHC
jgi:hypothetical protein